MNIMPCLSITPENVLVAGRANATVPLALPSLRKWRRPHEYWAGKTSSIGAGTQIPGVSIYKEEGGDAAFLFAVLWLLFCMVNSRYPVSYTHLGSIAPMHCTGIGKLFLSEASAEELERLIAVKGLPGYTRNTLTRREDLLPELERIRARGYAYDQEECEIGARCVAFPIRDYTGKIVAGISITGPSTRLSDAFIDARLDSLRLAAAEMSQKLGYTG